MRRIASNLLATLISLVIAALGLELLTRLVVDDGMPSCISCGATREPGVPF